MFKGRGGATITLGVCYGYVISVFFHFGAGKMKGDVNRAIRGCPMLDS